MKRMHHDGGVERHNDPAGQGPVVVDIGGDVGALVLHTEAELNGVEIEISPVGEDGDRQHVAVLPRAFGGRTAHAAVYPALAAGSYRLWQRDGLPTEVIAITGGRVSEVSWSDITGRQSS